MVRHLISVLIKPRPTRPHSIRPLKFPRNTCSVAVSCVNEEELGLHPIRSVSQRFHTVTEIISHLVHLNVLGHHPTHTYTHIDIHSAPAALNQPMAPVDLDTHNQ